MDSFITAFKWHCPLLSNVNQERRNRQAWRLSRPCELFSLNRVYTNPYPTCSLQNCTVLVKTNSLKYIPYVGSHYFKNMNFSFADSLDLLKSIQYQLCPWHNNYALCPSSSSPKLIKHPLKTYLRLYDFVSWTSCMTCNCKINLRWSDHQKIFLLPKWTTIQF